MPKIAAYPELQKAARVRADILLQDNYQQISMRADRLFAGLFLFQWFIGICLAFWISPRIWAGTTSQVHSHVTLAIADVVGRWERTVSNRQAAEWVEVRVADTGTGIPERVRSQIFNPFFTTKVVGKGTGQGLSLAHAIIVEKHEGTLTFETEMGRGTTFILRLPLEQPANTWKEAA